MHEFFAMGGYGFYVWSAYGMTLAVIVIEIVAVRARERRAAVAAAAESGRQR